MESIEFLKSKLIELSKTLSYLEIKYEYRSYIHTHIVEVNPVDCFNKDKDYIDYQISLEDDFENLYPNEEILFVTSNELITVDNPIIELGIYQEDCSYELVAPIKVEFSIDDYYEYLCETKIPADFYIPEPPPIGKLKWKSPFKSKKALIENQGFFCKLAS